MNNSTFDLIIFDCDGVLVNSEPLTNQVYVQMLGEYGYPVNTEEYLREFSGAVMYKRLEVTSQKLNWNPPSNFLSIFNEWLSMLTESELKPVPGIHALIESLTVPICLASNGSREEILLRLRIAQLTECFGNAIFSGLEVPHPKPAPDVYLTAARAFNVPPSSCIVIEDSVPGVTAAVRAGMKVNFDYGFDETCQVCVIPRIINRTMEKSRLEAFSDGVFAIVITLLILDIRFPEVPYSQFFTTLVSVLPRILAYVLSFIIIGLYWVIHHNSMHAIKETDRGFLWLNILLLLRVSFIPFPTSLLGRYPFQAGPLIIYGLTLIDCNAVGIVMLVYVYYHPHLAVAEFSKQYMRSHTPNYIIVNGAYLGAILLAHSFPLLSYLIYIAVVVLLIIFLPKLDDGINYQVND